MPYVRPLAMLACVLLFLVAAPSLAAKVSNVARIDSIEAELLQSMFAYCPYSVDITNCYPEFGPACRSLTNGLQHRNSF